jgi:hypothetical protein
MDRRPDIPAGIESMELHALTLHKPCAPISRIPFLPLKLQRLQPGSPSSQEGHADRYHTVRSSGHDCIPGESALIVRP